MGRNSFTANGLTRSSTSWTSPLKDTKHIWQPKVLHKSRVGLDFYETFAPIAKLMFVSMFLSVAIEKDVNYTK